MKGLGSATSNPSGVSWAAAKAKSDQIKGYPSFSTRNNGFFSRQRRKISASLPRFGGSAAYGEKEKLGRGRWNPNNGSFLTRLKTLVGNLLRRKRVQLLLFLILMFVSWLIFYQRESPVSIRTQLQESLLTRALQLFTRRTAGPP